MIYGLTISFTIIFVLYQKYQFKDKSVVRNITWKRYGVAMRIWNICTPLVMAYFPAHWQDYLVCGALNELLFELLINKIALNQGWLFVGSSSDWDKLGKNKWWIMCVILTLTILVKIFIHTKF